MKLVSNVTHKYIVLFPTIFVQEVVSSFSLILYVGWSDVRSICLTLSFFQSGVASLRNALTANSDTIHVLFSGVCMCSLEQRKGETD